MDLKNKSCVPCEEGAPTLTPDAVKRHLEQVSDWVAYDNSTKIKKELVFENFKQTIEFVNKIAELAEQEGHHSNLYIYDFKKLRVELWTHKINGLHQNDFILASKIDDL